MGKESYALFTGLFVLILGAALVAASIWLGHFGEQRDTYTVITQASVTGLNPESTVLYRGVQVGKVTTVHFDPANAKNILVRIEIEKGLSMTQGTYATLRVQGLTGLAQIELNDSGDKPQPLTTSDANPTLIPLRPSLLDRITDSGEAIINDTRTLITSLNTVLDTPNRQHISSILTHLDTASSELAGLEQRMQKTFAQIDQAAVKIGGAGAKAQTTFDRFDTVAKDMEKLSTHLQTLTENANALALSGKETTDSLARTSLPRLNALLEELQAVTIQIHSLSGMLADDPGMLLYGHQPSPPGPGEPGYQETH